MTMSTIYTTGSWKPKAGAEDAFVEAWKAFAQWAATRPGVGTLHLTRDLKEPGRYVSFADWESAATVVAWKSTPEFAEGLARVRSHVDEFQPTELELIVEVGAPVATQA
jgi:heme-degrading monooxygenase HmoA